MDLVNQNKFKNGLIIVLLLVNLITISILWMKTVKEEDVKPSVEKESPKGESVSLMKQVLNLDDEQTKQLEKLRNDKLDLSKKYNDSLSLIKKQLADELFKSKSNEELVKEKSKKIGELQTKVELVRYNHFNELLAICTPEQKEKLKPIIQELFGRKPPKNDVMPETRKDDNSNKKEVIPNETIKAGETQQLDPKAPPSIDEKVEKYAQRLNLSDEQTQQVRNILLSLRENNKKSKPIRNANPDEFELEKEKRRLEEDENILKVLNPEQKIEFEKMQMKRKK